ncbi:hypothetical protein C9J48_22375 [Photobacterium profundum]|nr:MULTISPECIES: DUF1801 domain-containing protein [Photobacterium]PSV47385.1 hypothetical protein C9J47_10930 [Photobacterium indicum]PSV59788.1 hypothetical protein C9J48_22375 [Photobacterium profundum]
MNNANVLMVDEKYQSYPEGIRDKLLSLRQLVIDVSKKIDLPAQVQETINANEPSFVVDGGSPIRIDWKSHTPNQYAMYFQCKTKLVDTFKELYDDTFRFDDDKGIVFTVDDDIATRELAHCISLSLRYHQIKHLPLLGV